jgi:O-antigen/teichoic acid export membrane protein
MDLPRIQWTTAFPVALGAALTAFCVRLPIFFVGAASIAAAGIFDVSQRIQSAGSLGVSAVATALLPNLSQASRGHDRKPLWIQILFGAVLGSAVPLVLLIILLSVGQGALEKLLGPAYSAAWLPGVLLLFAALVNSWTSSLSNLLSITGSGRYFAWISGTQLFFIVMGFVVVEAKPVSAAIIVLCAEGLRSVLLALSAIKLFRIKSSIRVA